LQRVGETIPVALIENELARQLVLKPRAFRDANIDTRDLEVIEILPVGPRRGILELTDVGCVSSQARDDADRQLLYFAFCNSIFLLCQIENLRDRLLHIALGIISPDRRQMPILI